MIWSGLKLFRPFGSNFWLNKVLQKIRNVNDVNNSFGSFKRFICLIQGLLLTLQPTFRLVCLDYYKYTKVEYSKFRLKTISKKGRDIEFRLDTMH